MLPAKAPGLRIARRALSSALVALCALGAVACSDPDEPVLGSWTVAASTIPDDTPVRWQFDDDGTFTFDDFRDSGEKFGGLWSHDEDQMRLEWFDEAGDTWPEEFNAYVDDNRLGLYVFLDQEGSEGVAGDYLTSRVRYWSDGELYDARRSWILLLDDGSVAYNGYYGVWSEIEIDGYPAVRISLEIDGAIEEFRLFAIADRVLTTRIYEREL